MQYEMIDRTTYDLGFWEAMVPLAGWHESRRIVNEYETIEAEYGVTSEDIQAWEDNFRDPKGLPEDPGEHATAQERQEYEEQLEEYLNQPVEVDARRSPYEDLQDMTLEEFEQLQRDAGIPVGS